MANDAEPVARTLGTHAATLGRPATTTGERGDASPGGDVPRRLCASSLKTTAAPEGPSSLACV
eukprot:1821833-Prymnesium_polylepis.1